jgi:hypothetical protein
MTLSEKVDRKFIEQIDVSDWEVETDTGWADVISTNKTVPYDVYTVTTETGKILKCADTHILFDENFREVFAKDCANKKVQTRNGLELVTSVVNTAVADNMFDLSVDSKDHRYYTNDFLSHNTTVMAAVFCHYVIFNDDKTCAILANKAATSREILSRVKLAYEHLPKWLQHGVVEWNKGSIQLENGSRILAGATSGSAIRGFSISFLFLDEFAFVPNNIAEEFFTSVYPTISSGKNSKLAIISTPDGMNHFYKLWTEALEGINGFSHVKATWRDIPSRDAEWERQTRAVLGEQKFSQEMDVEFLGASNTLINGSKLKSIPVTQPVYSNAITSVYAKPEPGRKYCITVDTSRGTGGDYSAFLVIDVTELPYQVVFKYRNNTVSSLLYPSLICKVAQEYNNCTVLVESNDVGESVAASLYYDLEYEEVIFSKSGEICGWSGGSSAAPGLRTTTKTKRRGCDILKQLIESDKLLINDYDILYELSNFVVKGSSYEADVGHDDLVMCLVMFSYLTTTAKFEEISDQSVRDRIILERRLLEEQEMMPVGYYNNGIEDPIDDFTFQ